MHRPRSDVARIDPETLRLHSESALDQLFASKSDECTWQTAVGMRGRTLINYTRFTAVANGRQNGQMSEVRFSSKMFGDIVILFFIRVIAVNVYCLVVCLTRFGLRE